MAKGSDEWVHEQTFGTRTADFWWLLDEGGALSILRVHMQTGRKQRVVRAFGRDELAQIVGFLADGAWHPPAADASLLKRDPPATGIATFLHRVLGRSTSDSILAAQLSVVLTQAGVWEWDRRRSRMNFRQVSDDLGRLSGYFARRQADPGPRPPSEKETPLRHQRNKPQPPAFDLAAAFRAFNAELLAHLEALDGGHHATGKGQRREAAFRDFLRRHLPARFGVGHGEVTTPWGEISREVDILIYDAAGATPFLHDADEALVLPIECVYAAIEVKPLLNAVQLRDALGVVRSVKALRLPAVGSVPSPRPPILGGLLACRSIAPEVLARRLREAHEGTSPSLWMDCVCILNKAVIHRQCGMPGPGDWTPEATDTPIPLGCVEAGEDSLFYFYLLLRRDLEAKRLDPPDLMQYATGLCFPEPTYP